MGLDDQALTNHFFLDFLSEKCHCLPEAILSYDLTVYPCETGCSLGWHDEFISSPRLDNLTSVLACLMGLVLGPGFLEAGVLMLLIGPRNLRCTATQSQIPSEPTA